MKRLPAMHQTGIRSLGGEDPLEKGKATHSSNLAWRASRGQRSLVGYSPWGLIESDTTEATLHTHMHACLYTVFRWTSGTLKLCVHEK